MLEHIGEQLIMPSYHDLQGALAAVQSASDAFETDRTEARLNTLRAALLEAYEAWEHCSVFEFGPAAESNMRLSMNTFPADTTQINNNTANGDYDLSAAQNADAQGFAAIEFLLFGHGDVANVLHELEGSDNQRLRYISDCLEKMIMLTEDVILGWESYSTEFKSNTGSDVGSPIGLMINEINFEFELLKNARVGIPLGKKTLGVTQPEKVEGYFSGHSTALALANLDGISDAFSGGVGSGFDDYLDALGAMGREDQLSTEVEVGFTLIREELEQVARPLDEVIEGEPLDLEPLYVLLEAQVVKLKTDVPSQLGVQITYQDNDGD